MSTQAVRTLLWAAIAVVVFVFLLGLFILGTISEISVFVALFLFSAFVAVFFAGQ